MRATLSAALVLLAFSAAWSQEAGQPPPGMPPATQVEAITVRSEAGLLTGKGFLFRTRVNIDIDGYAKPKIDFLVAGGRRMVIDLPGVVNKSARTLIPLSDTCVKRVRIAEHKKPKKVRVVLDLQENVGYDVIDVSFVPLPAPELKPRGRLVITLTQKSL